MGKLKTAKQMERHLKGISNHYRIEILLLIDNNKDLSEYGIKATWYHFPEVNLELKMALSLHGISETENGNVKAMKLKIFSAPINATYKNTFDYDVTGTSTIKAKIVSIPPPIEVKGT